MMRTAVLCELCDGLQPEIAYVSDETGKYQVYTQPFMGPGGRTLISAGGGSEAAWASNSELVYIDNDNDSLTAAHRALVSMHAFGPHAAVEPALRFF